MPAPGWYDDPSGTGGQRWWDGQRWGAEQRWPPPPPQPTSQGAPVDLHIEEAAAPGGARRHPALWWGLFGLAAVLALAAGFFGTRWWADADDPGTVVASQPDVEPPGQPEVTESAGDGERDDPAGEGQEQRVQAGEDAGGPSESVTDLPSPPPEGLSDEAEPLTEPEIAAAFEGYLQALDGNALGIARTYLAPELASRDGWKADEFVEFWDGRLAGATLVEVVDLDAGRGELLAVVDYALPDGVVSREEILATFVRGSDGQPLMADYVVLATDRR